MRPFLSFKRQEVVFPEFCKISCPMSVCPVGQGRDQAVRNFTVLVYRRLAWTIVKFLISWLCSVTSHLTINIPGTQMTYASCSAIGNYFYCRSLTFSRTLFNLRTLKSWKFLKMLEDIMIREFIPEYYYDDWLLSTVNYKKNWQ